MRYIDKALNFFMSKYMNNTSFKHSSIAFLKMYFERNNKQIDTSFTKWGNVFRNNKWSDLKIQNVKVSFLDQKKQIFILFFCLLFALIYLNFLDFTFNSWTSFYNRGVDALYQLFFTVGLFFHYLATNYLSKFSKTSAKSIISPSTNLSSLDKGVKSPVFSENSNNSNIDNLYIKSMSNSYKISYFLSKSKNIDNLLDTDNGLSLLKKNKFDYLLLLNNLNSKKSNSYYRNYSDMYSTNLLNNNDMNIEFSLNINEVNNLLKSNPDYQNSIVNLSENSNIAKQIRWKAINSLSLQGLSSSNKALTEAKQLIGSSSYDNSLTSNNMWWSNSTNLNYRPLDLNFRFDNNLQDLISSNLNFLEVSREFTIKSNDNKTLNKLMFTTESINNLDKFFSKNDLNYSLGRFNLSLSTENILNVLNSSSYSLVDNYDSVDNLVRFNSLNLNQARTVKIDNYDLLSWELLNVISVVPTINTGLELEVPQFTLDSKSNVKLFW